MRITFRAALSLVVLAVMALLPGPAMARVWASVYPARVVPGGVFEVKAGDTSRAGEAVEATARFQGQHVPLVTLRGVDRALMGVPASMTPGTYPVAVEVNGHMVRVSMRVLPRYFPSQNIHMAAGKTGLMDEGILARERAILNAAYERHTPRPLWTGGFLIPAAGPHTSAWGRRRTVNGRPWGQHQGADIAAGTGTTIQATNAGRVLVARRLWMRGNTVVIDHGLGVFSAYNHLSRLDVAEGQSVGRGQRIGLVGATGFVTGAHLHWEMHVGRVSVEPWPIVKNGLPLG